MQGIGCPGIGDVRQTVDSRESIVMGLYDNFRWQIILYTAGSYTCARCHIGPPISRQLNKQEMEQSQKHLQFLNDKDRELSMLHRHSEVKILFLRYNTTLPSSAPVERLFSAGALVLTKRRNRLSDTLFESLVLLKLNKHLLWTVI